MAEPKTETSTGALNNDSYGMLHDSLW